MDKELYRKIQYQNNVMYEFEKEIKEIEKVTIKEKAFHDKTSIEAFKTINAYLKNKKNEYSTIALLNRDDKKELINSCNHEIGIKDTLSEEYYCLICQRPLICESYKACKLLIDVTKEKKVLDVISEIFDEVMYSDKDLVSTMEKQMQNIQYEYEVKIIRR